MSNGENVRAARMAGNTSDSNRIRNDAEKVSIARAQVQPIFVSRNSNILLWCCAVTWYLALNSLVISGFHIVNHNSILVVQARHELAPFTLPLHLHTPQYTQRIVSHSTMHACSQVHHAPLRRGLMCSERKGVLCHPCSAPVPRPSAQDLPHACTGMHNTTHHTPSTQAQLSIDFASSV